MVDEMTQQDDITQRPLTGDETRAAVREARSMTAPSDTTEPGDYVMAGARALLSKLRAPVADERAALQKLVDLEDMRLHLKALHEMGHGTDYDYYHKALSAAWKAARAALASASGHKPAPVDTSPGHSAPVAGEQIIAWDVQDTGLGRRYTTYNPKVAEDLMNLGENVRPLVYASALPPANAAPQASAEDDREGLAHKVNLLTAELLGHRSAAGHLSALVDELRGHLIDARQAMADFQQAFVPAFDTPETLTMVPNEALTPFCAALDRLCELDLPQADKDGAVDESRNLQGNPVDRSADLQGDKDGGQQRAGDAERWRWATATDENAQMLYTIVQAYGGDQQKINERADFYRAALSATQEPSK
ncbi:hypothetical protein ACOTEY_00460 [Achromobacter xylosoxidans]